MKVISATLGHSRSSFTADTYASVLPEVAKAAAEAVAAVVPLRRDGHTMATPGAEKRTSRNATGTPSRSQSWTKSLVRVAEDRGFEPRMGVNPNRISSAAP